MSDTLPELSKPGLDADLQTVLAAWHVATLRLERTHEALRGEVQRLTRELESKNRQLQRKNRLADLGRIAAHIAHELRNSLVPVTLYMSLLRRRLADDPGSLDVLDKIEASFASLDTAANDLLQFTSDKQACRREVDIRRLMESVCTSVAPQVEAQYIRAGVEVPAGLIVHADEEMIRRALLNLLLNSLDAMPNGGELTLAAQRHDRDVRLVCRDSGPGLSDEAQQRASEPFFTTKSSGTGLGLAIVERVAEAHGGKLTCGNHAQGGAEFCILLPDRPQEAAV